MKKSLLLAGALLALLTMPAAAGAVVYVAGTGEPAFTNTTSNTNWVMWQGSSAYESYRIEFDNYDNSVFKTTQVTSNVTPNGSGTLWANWQGIVSPLQEGHSYGICAYGRYTIGGIPARDTGSCFDADQTGKRTFTTIDLTKPTIAVKIDGGAPFSRTAKLNYAIDYSDNLAFPFPANFLCRDIGADPATACAGSSLAYNEACSVPLGGMKKVTYFNCDEDLSKVVTGDGPVTLCVSSADAAIPDNPSAANQSASASSANISSRVCDSIQIDRTAPVVSVGVAASTVTVGDLVSVTAQASDATSGLSGAYAWTWGDNTAAGSGETATHTFTAPGTYAVSVATKDNAGNETTATKTITVVEKQTTPGGGGSATTGVTAPVTVKEIVQAAGGGGGTQSTEVAGLDVLAPKRVKQARKARTLAIALTADTPGTASLAFVRAGRVHAKGIAKLAAAGTVGYKLRLPKKLKAGAYQLKVSFQPAGAARAATKTLKVAVVSARKKVAKASAAATAPRIDEASAPVGVPTGKAPAAPRSHWVRLG